MIALKVGRHGVIKTFDVLRQKHPLLNKRSEAIKDMGDPRVKEAVALMQIIMKAKSVGGTKIIMGLSANQVGLDLRLIAFRQDLHGRHRIRLIGNPEIAAKSDRLIDSMEGCLSSPGLTATIRRHARIQLRGWDCLEDKHTTETLVGESACVVQHEVDHLDGIPWPQTRQCDKSIAETIREQGDRIIKW